MNRSTPERFCLCMPRSASTASIGSGAGWTVTGRMLSGADQLGVVGKQFLHEAEQVMTVGEGVMDVEGRLRLSVTDGQSEADQRSALVEVQRGAFGRRITESPHHLDSRGEKVVGDEFRWRPSDPRSRRAVRTGRASSSAS